jgi:hypothetical protein
MRIGKDGLEIVIFCISSKALWRPQDRDPAKVILERIRYSPENTYTALCELSGVPATVLRHRDHGQMLIPERAAMQQRFSPQEEKALVSYLLRISANGYRIPVNVIMPLSFSVPPFSRFPRLIAMISNLLERIGHRPSVNASQSLKLCE